MFNELLKIQQMRERERDQENVNSAEGNLVLFNCGHRGQPNRSEEKRVSRLMRKSGFIPMLDQI